MGMLSKNRKMILSHSKNGQQITNYEKDRRGTEPGFKANENPKRDKMRKNGTSENKKKKNVEKPRNSLLKSFKL